jgi:hypothetical protein
LIAWLLDRGFTVDGASLTPMMLLANRVRGDDGVYASTREMSRLGTPPRCPAMCGAPRVRRAIGSVDVKCVVSTTNLKTNKLPPTMPE